MKGHLAIQSKAGRARRSRGRPDGPLPLHTRRNRLGKLRRGTAAYQVFCVSSTETGPCSPLFHFLLWLCSMANSSAHFADEEIELRRWCRLLGITQPERGGHGLELRPASVQDCCWFSPECPAEAGELGLTQAHSLPGRCCSTVTASVAARWPCGNVGQVMDSELGRRGFKPQLTLLWAVWPWA